MKLDIRDFIRPDFFHDFRPLVGYFPISRKKALVHFWLTQQAGSPVASGPLNRRRLGGRPRESLHCFPAAVGPFWVCAEPVLVHSWFLECERRLPLRKPLLTVFLFPTF